jgi:hypothetical protein
MGDDGGSVTQSQLERRCNRRFSLHLPAVVKFLDATVCEVEAHTRDVSSRGAFLYLNAELREGAAIEFVMTLPSEITLNETISIQCSGKVVRVEPLAGEQGAAVAMDKYDFVGHSWGGCAGA